MTEEWKKGQWTTVAVPKKFKEEVMKFLDVHPFYVSFAEFCRDAMRIRLDRLLRIVEETKEE